MESMKPVIPLLSVMLLSAFYLDCSPEAGRKHPAHPLGAQIQRLHARSSVDRARAAQELGRIGADAAPAVPDLVGLLGDNGQSQSWVDRLVTKIYRILNPLGGTGMSTVGEEAMKALTRIGPPAVDALIAATRQQNNDARIRSVCALRLIGDARAYDTFRAGLHDRSERVRYESLWGIAELRQGDTVDALASLLEEPSGNIRTNAIHGLARIGGENALAALTKELQHRDTQFRIAVCEVLSSMQNADAVPPLITLLNDPEWSVRMSAAQALGSRKDMRSARPLIDALGDRDDTVRTQAASALMLVTGSNLGSDKARWEDWWKERQPTMGTGASTSK
jgi:HEAT repeat protein